MIITLSTYDIADRLMRDSNANWSRPGALALAEYLQEMEEGTGETMELDVVAIRCDFSEYPSAVDAHNTITHGHDLTEDEEEETALARMREVGEVIVFNGGVIISK
jgi:hypothetical protein